MIETLPFRYTLSFDTGALWCIISLPVLVKAFHSVAPQSHHPRWTHKGGQWSELVNRDSKKCGD